MLPRCCNYNLQMKKLRTYFAIVFYKQTYKLICKNDESKQQKRSVLILNRLTTVFVKINACADLAKLA